MSAEYNAKPTQQGALKILAEIASNARPSTLHLSGEPNAKGFLVQEDLGQNPLTVGDRVFNTGSLVAILRKNPATQRYTLEFRIYERVQMIQEQGSQDVELMSRNPIGEREGLYVQGGLYAKVTPGNQLTIRRLTAAAITRKIEAETAEAKAKKEALKSVIQDECRHLEIALAAATERDQSAAGLRIVSDMFRKMFTQPKKPDKIVIPNPANPSQGTQIDALIVSRIDQGWLVALFKPFSPAEYQIYDKLGAKAQNDGTTLYTPLRTLQTHQQIYEKRNPMQQSHLLSATIRAIYIRSAQ